MSYDSDHYITLDDDFDRRFASMVRDERKRRKLSQRELADKAKVSLRTLQSLEYGKPVGLKYIRKVLDALDVKVMLWCSGCVLEGEYSSDIEELGRVQNVVWSAENERMNAVAAKLSDDMPRRVEALKRPRTWRNWFRRRAA